MEYFLLIYLAAISLFAAVICIADKLFAIKGMWRISEKLLLAVSFLGGATAMYITMLLIRHKTKHKKFMLGLPAFIALHIIMLLFFLSRY